MVERIDNVSAASVEYVRNTVVAASYNDPTPFSECYLGRQASIEGVRFQGEVTHQAALVNIANIESSFAVVDCHDLASLAEGCARSEEYQ